MKILLFLASLFQIIICFLYKFQLDVCFLVFINLILGYLISKYNITLKNNFLLIFLMFYIFFSTLFVAVFKYAPVHFSLSSSRISIEDFSYLAIFSVKLIFVYLITTFVFYPFINKKSIYSTVKSSVAFYPSTIILVLFFLFMFFLSFLSFIIGIGRMGVVNTELPFRLSGIIQFIRVDVAPVFALLVYFQLKFRNHKNKLKFFLLFYFLWLLFESFVRLSKSSLLTGFLPIILFEFIYYNNIKDLFRKIKVLLPFFAIFIFFYFVVENIRNQKDKSITSSSFSISSDLNATFVNPNGNDLFIRPFTRIFMTGYHFLTSHSYISSESFFDFSNSPTIIFMGGSARFQTYVIDGYPIGVPHSSGSTSLIDALLVGGYGLSFIIFAVFVVLSIIIDFTLRSSMPIEITIVFYLLFIRIFNTLSVSIFVDPMSIRYIIVYSLLIFFLSFHSKSKLS